MAMQYSPCFTYSGALTALALMTILSTGMGHIVPNVIPPKFTNFVAVVLFLFFGVKMLREAYDHVASDEDPEEMKEVCRGGAGLRQGRGRGVGGRAAAGWGAL